MYRKDVDHFCSVVVEVFAVFGARCGVAYVFVHVGQVEVLSLCTGVYWRNYVVDCAGGVCDI